MKPAPERISDIEMIMYRAHSTQRNWRQIAQIVDDYYQGKTVHPAVPPQDDKAVKRG